MVWIVATTSVVGTGVALTLAGGDDGFVSRDVVLGSGNGRAVDFGGNGTIIIVHGSIVGAQAITTGSARNSTIAIEAEGRVTGLFSDPLVTDSGNAINLQGGTSTIRNEGIIEALGGGNAISYTASQSLTPITAISLENNGLISGQNAILLGGLNGGISFDLLNTGRIEAEAIAFRDSSDQGSTDTLVNRGFIAGAVDLGLGDDSFDGRGGRLDGLLSGGAGNDTLRSGADADTIVGGGGQDRLFGGRGADRFVFDQGPGTTDADRIEDFGRPDRIHLDSADFTALADGALAAGAFRANASGRAADASDRIVYETDTGWLRYDADGRGGSAGVRFAQLDAGLRFVDAGDFLVI